MEKMPEPVEKEQTLVNIHLLNLPWGEIYQTFKFTRDSTTKIITFKKDGDITMPSIPIDTLAKPIYRNIPYIPDAHLSPEQWVTRIADIEAFLTGVKDEISDVPMAIGSQNFIYMPSSKQMLAGIRIKVSQADATTAACLARGAFNTGYMLMKSNDKKGKPISAPTNITPGVQDLFKTSRHQDIISTKTDYEQLPLFEASHKHIHKLKLADEANPCYAFFFVNKSRFCPRLEVGVVKYMTVEAKKDWTDGKFIRDFGRDKYASTAEKNFWLWVTDGTIVCRSYACLDDIEGYSKTKLSRFKRDWGSIVDILFDNNELIKNQVWGRYLPVASDEVMSDEMDVFKATLPSPARSIVECC